MRKYAQRDGNKIERKEEKAEYKMNIMNLEQISKTYGEKTILDQISVGVESGEKIGIIGINGTGKTTLFRIIAGLEEPDTGKVIFQNGIKIGYLMQGEAMPENLTVLEYTAGVDAESWSREAEAGNILNQLGMTEHGARIGTLSGGQKKRAALAKVLMEKTDVLLLDEPTNHLDESAIRWLEDYLKRSRKTIILVTHDRYFLDQVSNRIWEISRGELYSYQADYSRFLELKAQREVMEQASERKRQSVLRIETEWARRGCRARSTKQRARLQRLDQLRQMEAPQQDLTIEMDSIETRMGKKTIELHHVSKRFGDKIILNNFDSIFLRDQKVGIVGPNGCGKSTILKLIAGELPPDEGQIEFGETIKIGYFAQEIPQEKMNPSQRVIDYVKDIAEYIPTREGRITASQMLERFLFPPKMQYEPIGKLSGGEKRRLYLLGTLQTAPNVLIMDEVSNEMDIPTITILEDYLNSFHGIVIMVSHDRYFLDNVADRIFEHDGKGNLIQYEGGYTDYLEAKKRKEGDFGEKSGQTESTKEKKDKEGETAGRSSWKKRENKLKFTYQEQKEFDTIEEVIADLEEKLETIDQQMMENATNSGKLNELTLRKETYEKLLEEKMDRWVYLNDLAEKIKKSFRDNK